VFDLALCGGVGVDRFPDRFFPSVEGLQLGTEQLSVSGSMFFDFQPLGVDGFARFAVLTVGFLRITVGVEGQSAEQQIGEQVGAALLFGARASAPRERAIAANMPSMAAASGGGDFAGDIPMPSGPCTTVTRRSAKARRCRCWKANGSSCTTSRSSHTWSCFGDLVLRRLDRLIVDGVEGGGLGDSARHSINKPDLVGVQLAAAERLPHGRQAIGEATGACQQAAHRVGLVTQHHRQLVGDELTRPAATGAAGPDAGGGALGEPGVSGVHRCFCQPGERGRRLPPGITTASLATAVSS
jgi:hypothetical protein